MRRAAFALMLMVALLTCTPSIAHASVSPGDDCQIYRELLEDPTADCPTDLSQTTIDDASKGVLLMVAGAWLILAILPAAIARNKGYTYWLWWLYSIFLFPLAFLHANFLAPRQKALDERALRDGLRPCPRCYEWTRPSAITCRYCNELLEQVLPPPQPVPAE